MRGYDQDRALRAVARVREVREKDSRIGLAASVRERAASVLAAERARARLAAAPASATDGTALAAGRRAADVMGEDVRARRDEADVAARVTEEAQGRWEHDAARLRAVEELLRRRAQVRAERADRAEQHEADDLAGQSWRRRHGEAR